MIRRENVYLTATRKYRNLIESLKINLSRWMMKLNKYSISTWNENDIFFLKKDFCIDHV